MKLYADSSTRRSRQMLGDVLLVVWVALWVELALVVRDATLVLTGPGEQIAEAGSRLEGGLRQAGRAVGEVPLVGDDVQAPFDGAGNAARRLAEAGDAQVAAVEQLAFWLALATGAVPILLAVLLYVPFRVGFVREATAGQRFVDSTEDLDLFALRAMARQPMHRLAKVSPDPVGAWRDRDEAVIRGLATLELRDAGLEPPPVGRVEP